MIALLAAAALVAPPAQRAPGAVLANYQAALARLAEPRVFTVEYTLEQSGTRTLEQRHRIFRSGGDERDETIAVNGTKALTPQIRIFRRRPYRYTVAALAPRPQRYAFRYVGAHKNGRHVDYVFRTTPLRPAGFAVTSVTVDGVAFLPAAISFTTAGHGGSGAVTFAKADRWWVARSAQASARLAAGTARERLSFARWRFPASLPSATFAVSRALRTPPPLPLLPPRG